MQMKSFPSPDIGQYKNRYQYATYLTESAQEYRLYIMDREVWIADFHGKYIWSIYKLIKTDAIKPNVEGGFIIPEVPVNRLVGFQLLQESFWPGTPFKEAV